MSKSSEGPAAGAGAASAEFVAAGEGGLAIKLVRDLPDEARAGVREKKRIPIKIADLRPAEKKQLVTRIVPQPLPAPPERVERALKGLDPRIKRFHGVRVPLYWLPPTLVRSPCADMFGYMTTPAVRNASKLPFDATHQQLLDDLGQLMGDPGREVNSNSTIPAGLTYFGQFVDHDITFDVTSTIDNPVDANTIPNMRRPSLDLDSVYGRGPALDPYLYVFPASGPATAVKLLIGTNSPTGTGGPLTAAATPATPSDFDVPRAQGTLTAVVGDPRNDENLIVSQFHHAVLKFHNAVVDFLVGSGFAGDIFAEAKRIVTHHYQWCVVHDFLLKLCGSTAVNNAIMTVSAPVGSPFRMPVEFAVGAYRFGHSMIRNGYILNTSLGGRSLDDVFAFVRVPNLPVFSNWAVDFNMFFNTAHPVGQFNVARKIDSVLATGLETIPGGSGIMSILASRNLRRGLAFGLPSGQAAATALGVIPLTAAQLTQGLPANEVTLLQANSNTLLNKTPLWYYVLREAAVLEAGERLGPLGARIVAETFVRLLKRDADSYMNVPGFTPTLPSSVPGTFTIADLLEFAGVLVQ
jgi:hypothetical protein